MSLPPPPPPPPPPIALSAVPENILCVNLWIWWIWRMWLGANGGVGLTEEDREGSPPLKEEADSLFGNMIPCRWEIHQRENQKTKIIIRMLTTRCLVLGLVWEEKMAIDPLILHNYVADFRGNSTPLWGSPYEKNTCFFGHCPGGGGGGGGGVCQLPDGLWQFFSEYKPLEVCQLQSARQASGWNESESYAFSPIWDELNTSNSFFPKIQHQRHDHWSATLDHPRTIVTTLNINIAPFFLLIFSHLTGPEKKSQQ